MSSELHDLIEKELQAADVRIEAGVRASAPVGSPRSLGIAPGAADTAGAALRRAARHPVDTLRETFERAKAFALGAPRQRL